MNDITSPNGLMWGLLCALFICTAVGYRIGIERNKQFIVSKPLVVHSVKIVIEAGHADTLYTYRIPKEAQ